MNLQMSRSCVVAAVGVLLCRAALADVVTLNPTLDGVQQRTGFPFPTFTYTTASASLQSSFTQSASHANVYISELTFALEFDLSSIASGAWIQSATIAWTERGDYLSPGNTHTLLGSVGDGALSTADFNGTALVQVANGVNDGRVQFDVTSFVADRVAAGDHYVSFAVNNGGYYTESSGPFSSVTTVSAYMISSRLDPDVAARPTLTLTVVPEANSAALAGLGLIVAGASSTWRARRRRTLV